MNYYALSSSDVVMMMQGVATLNLAYLGVCVTIILFAGGFTYIFNVKPLQDALKKQEEKLEILTKDVENKISQVSLQFSDLVIAQTRELDSTRDTTKKEIDVLKETIIASVAKMEVDVKELTANANQELINLKKNYQQTVLDTLWNEHYLWSFRGTHANTLLTLRQYMERAIEYRKLDNVHLWFTSVGDVLDEILKKNIALEANETDKFIKIMSRIEGFNDRKLKITEALSKIKSKETV